MKGICFKEPLFHATIEGRKTQTRRLIEPQPVIDCAVFRRTIGREILPIEVGLEYVDGENGVIFNTVKPRYKIGDVIYLKEPYAAEYIDATMPVGRYRLSYKFGGDDRFVWGNSDDVGYGDYEKIRSSMEKSKDGYANKLFMYGWAARYFIEITDVRAERLQDISDDDCFKEGILPFPTTVLGEATTVNYYTCGQHLTMYSSPQHAYSFLIDKINGNGTWDSNPYVWVYDYRLTKKP
ncbi:hypothetical protein [uncultured Alistipes sp.]|jgi:hypothetical protein|uniref:hypothetical protein n=1 Tax=uncultured Alistipes sp. TaxID=538949 RepID=UPI0025E6CC76|nr:hypothetical protein [uncultured Alistipes sp.]